jgi:hypothetical protein
MMAMFAVLWILEIKSKPCQRDFSVGTHACGCERSCCRKGAVAGWR